MSKKTIADMLLDEDNEKGSFEYNGKEYELRIGSYPMAPLAMFVTIQEKGNEDPSKERIMTVCLGNYQSELSFVQFGASFIDINNFPEAIDILEDTELAEPYLKYNLPVNKMSGFVLYPLYEFDTKRLAELDPQGYAQYKQDWDKQCTIEQNKMDETIFGSRWSLEDIDRDIDELKDL
jgi:hypothetical protein